jgi:hypothetical protein
LKRPRGATAAVSGAEGAKRARKEDAVAPQRAPTALRRAKRTVLVLNPALVGDDAALDAASRRLGSLYALQITRAHMCMCVCGVA